MDNSATQHHVNELNRLSAVPQDGVRRSRSQRAKLNLFFAYIFYVTDAIYEWVLSAANQLGTGEPFRHPISFISSLIVFPVIWTLLGLVVGLFWLGKKLGLGKVVSFIGERSNGLGTPNWANPDLFGQESDQIFQQATRLLGQPAPPTTGNAPSIFSLPIAKACLILSALVYERDNALVRKAAKKSFKDPTAAEQILRQSEASIRAQANRWDLNFEGVSDLSSVGGAFASLFSPKDTSIAPWIVVVFKGTTPNAFAEFLVDATISKVDSTKFLGAGMVHQGFYEDLFGADDGSIGGYGAIVAAVTNLAKKMGRGGTPIPLWITGHSLGSALASLLHARFAFAPEDLNDKKSKSPLLALRQTYSYGTPSLGSSQFLSSVATVQRNEIKKQSSVAAPILFRVVDDQDIVCRVPIGDARINSIGTAISQSSIFNFGHIGGEITMSEDSSGQLNWRSGENFGIGDVVVQGAQNYANSSPWQDGIVQQLLALLPAFAYDHFPARYYRRLGTMADGIN